MKRFVSILCVLGISTFCTACDTIDAVNPVVQAGKMQMQAKETTDEVTQIKQYAVEMQRREMKQLKNSEE